MCSRDRKEFVGCDKRLAIYKSRHRADLSRYHFCNLNLCHDRRHHIYIHTQTRGRLDSQKEREQMRTNGLAIPGTVGRPIQPSTLRGKLEGEILVSKVWEWEVWCRAIWGVRCRAKGNCDCESVMDALLCIQRGDRGVETERGEKMHESKYSEPSRA